MKEIRDGIIDWQKKVKVIKVILGCFTVGDIVDKVYPNDVTLALRTQSKFRTWGGHFPKNKKSVEFFNILATVMGFKPGTTGAMLITMSIDRFIQLLDSEDKQDLAYDALSNSGSDLGDVVGVRVDGVNGLFPAGPRRPPTNFRNIFVPRRGKIETIHTGLYNGRVNEKHYYLTPEAALTWSELVNAERYPTYDQCKLGLRVLMASKEWKSLIKAHKVSSAVILCGGGSPTKDVVLINALLDQELPNNINLDYVILDISPYMLLSSVWWLEETLATIEGGERINLIPLCEDVRAEFDTSVFVRGFGRTLFAITGGTIGNLSENDFFRNVPARSGDLLIVSADSLLMEDPGDVNSLINKYSHREMRKFISPAIHALIRHFDLQETFEKACDRVKVGIAAGDLANSDVPNSASVTLTAEVNGQTVTLLSSTRYIHDQLVQCARQFGWQHKASIPSPANKSFIQFLFEKSS